MKSLLETALDIAEENGISILLAALLLSENFSKYLPDRKETANACIN